MPRYYASISKEELQEKIESLLQKEEDGYYELGQYRTLTPTVEKDFNKIKVDTENVILKNDIPQHDPIIEIMGYAQLGDLTFFGFYCGGDWENPVYHIIYWDGKKLRGYIPTDGNPFNRKTKQAYGNVSPEYDWKAKLPSPNSPIPILNQKEVDEEESHRDDEFDPELIKQDILNRIQKKDQPNTPNTQNKPNSPELIFSINKFEEEVAQAIEDGYEFSSDMMSTKIDNAGKVEILFFQPMTIEEHLDFENEELDYNENDEDVDL